MKISISGPQCCGKSTLLEALKECGIFHNKYNFIDEPVRRLVREKGIKINKEASYEDQMLILQEHHLNTLRYNNFVSDRSALDAFAYATYDYINGKYTFGQWLDFAKIFEICFEQYDRIFILDPLPMVDDGFRSLDVEWQNETYNLMVKLSRKRAIVVPDYNVNERVEYIIKNIA